MAIHGDPGDPFEQAFLTAYPNPQRIDCPGDEITRKIARRKLPLDHPALEHLVQCSPCFGDVKRFQAEWSRARSRLQAAVIAAFVAIVSAGSVYVVLRQPWKSNSAAKLYSKSSVSSPAVTPQMIQTAVLNFETFSSERGVRTAPNLSELQHLPLSRLSLSIYLPKGSEPGDYEIKLIRNKLDENTLLQAYGSARIEDGLTVLVIPVDFSNMKAGKYVVAFRRKSGSWHFSNIALS